MKKLPKSLYVIEKKDGDIKFFLASPDMNELGIGLGDKTKIGLYKLEGFYDAEGVIETSKLQK